MIKDKLLIATYRGITFSFREAGRLGGRKTVFHTYPNSDIVLAEDLGRSPIVIPIVIIVKGEGDAYYEARDAIIKALESDGPSILEHPTYGQLKVQIDDSYRLNEKITQLGYSEINVSFRIVDNKKFLEADKNTESYIDAQKDDINKDLEDSFMSKIYSKAKSAYETLADYTEQAIEFGEDVSSAIFETIAAYNNYKAQLVAFITYYPSKISSLGSNVSSIFKSINNTVSNPLDQLNIYERYFNFLDDEPQFLPTTRDLYYSQQNQNAYKGFVQGTALAYAASAASKIDYSTDQQQAAVIQSISDQYTKVMDLPLIKSDQTVSLIDTPPQFSNEFETTDPTAIYNLLQNQKTAFLEVMKNKTVTIPKVTTVEVSNESLTNLVYRYYGSLENYDLIKDLNDLEETSLLNGTYKIVTA